jgi:uncharacterized protein YcaQ
VIVTDAEIRAAFLTRQGLASGSTWHSVHEAVSQVNAVQIDTIAVAARSHHLTLRHRVKDYDPEQLWKALHERELFEYYVHGNSFVPIEIFPYILHCMQRFPTHGYTWLRNSIPKYQNMMEKICQRIRDEGPLTSRDFKDPDHRSRGGWWDWKPAKSALELLWLMGQIVVVDRVGFRRVYDITERAVPGKYLDETVDGEEVWRYFLQRAVDCLAVASIKDVLGYFSFSVYALDKGRSRKGTIEEKVQVLEKEDIIVEIEVEGSKTPHYIFRDNLVLLEKDRKGEPSEDRAWFLSPFDNVVWNRERVRRLFQADVRLEAYVPKAKRSFGYFAMPIIWNNQIIGRLDPKVDRKSHTLTLVNFELTLPKEEEGDTLDAIREELADFMTFHECEQLVIDRCKPARLKDLLQ